MMETVPLVSVIIVTWNSKAHVFTCLDRLSQETMIDFEIIIIDNGSTDDELVGLMSRYPNLDLHGERLKSNQGYAAANNLGARLARGKWLALLNTDAFPEPDWLEQLLRIGEQNAEYCFFSSRQIQFNAPHLLDGAGDTYHVSGLAWRNGYKLLAKSHCLEQKEVFSACGAAALYLREDFLQAGGFDEDYFSYFEDVDLGFRLRLAGKKCLYVPEAVVHHVGSASTGKRSDFSVYYGYRNMIWTFLKNMPSPQIWLFLPIHIVTLLFFVLYLSIRGQGKIILRAIVDAICGLPRVIEKRKLIQRNRKIKPSELLSVMSTGLLEPYREFVQRNRMK